MGEDILLARLGQCIFAVEGVENYRILSPHTDITVPLGTLPVLTTLSVEGFI